ncbi:MAG: EF-hand domain-containing protein [Sphingomonadales bacterium]|nr:MAG: EF-hand domain-containing protein [Sphingomonadales bacterium]
MRGLILGAMILGGMAGQAVAQEAPRGPLFISPMGEPFRGPAPQDQWFDGADANHDGVLTVEEMTADADRFFSLLDTRKDGEIDPQDVERYETEIVPEIRVTAPRERQGYRVGDSMIGPRGGEGGPKQVSKRREPEARKGAARFSYLDYPQPITVADRNFNRGVDRREFAKAAETRFAMLDQNGDGRIPKSELPIFGKR